MHLISPIREEGARLRLVALSLTHAQLDVHLLTMGQRAAALKDGAYRHLQFQVLNVAADALL